MKVLVFSGNRADLFLLKPVIRRILETGGMCHAILSAHHRNEDLSLETLEVLQSEGLVVYFDGEDGRFFTTEEVGSLTFTSTSQICKKFQPDVALVLGDRYETLVAATAMATNEIPVAHIAGGEITHGSIDDLFRRAISQIASLHFPTSEAHSTELHRQGISPSAITVTAPLGFEVFKEGSITHRDSGSVQRLDPAKKTALVTLHPERDGQLSEFRARQLADALLESNLEHILWTAANGDIGGNEINRVAQQLAKENPNRVEFVRSLGATFSQELRSCTVFAGNSSSMATEAVLSGCHLLYIGSRQDGRKLPGRVQRVDYDSNQILHLINLLISVPKERPRSVETELASAAITREIRGYVDARRDHA